MFETQSDRFDDEYREVSRLNPGKHPGEVFHAVLVRTFSMECSQWALDTVREAQERLQAIRPESERFSVEILWIPDPTAFTGPGRYIYIARELLQRLPSNDAVAFVIAHEIAHHDLGHVINLRFESAWSRLGASAILAGLLYTARIRANSPRYENDADARALQMCVQAGYDADRCIEAFEILAILMLDLGQLDAVFGPEPIREPDGPIEALWSKYQHWKWEHRYGYSCLYDRIDALRRLEAAGIGEPEAANRIDSPNARETHDDTTSDQLARIDTTLEVWSKAADECADAVAAAMHVRAYGLLLGRNGRRPVELIGVSALSVADKFIKLKAARHLLVHILATIDHVRNTRARLKTVWAKRQAIAELESRMRAECPRLVQLGHADEMKLLLPAGAIDGDDEMSQLLDAVMVAANESKAALDRLDSAWTSSEALVKFLDARAAQLSIGFARLGMDANLALKRVDAELEAVHQIARYDPMSLPAYEPPPILREIERLEALCQSLESGLTETDRIMHRALRLDARSARSVWPQGSRFNANRVRSRRSTHSKPAEPSHAPEIQLPRLADWPNVTRRVT